MDPSVDMLGILSRRLAPFRPVVVYRFGSGMYALSQYARTNEERREPLRVFMESLHAR
jgi:hypothetical protein